MTKLCFVIEAFPWYLYWTASVAGWSSFLVGGFGVKYCHETGQRVGMICMFSVTFN